MGRIAGPLLRVLPNGVAVPIDFLEALEAAGIVLGSVQDVAVVEQVRVGADGPRVHHLAVKVHEVSAAAHPEKGVAVEGLRRVTKEQFGGPLEALVAKRYTGLKEQY